MEYPMFCAPGIPAELIPTNWTRLFNNGPPLLPGLIAAVICKYELLPYMFFSMW